MKTQAKEEQECFECKPINGSWDNIIAELVKGENETNSSVRLAGQYHLAEYSVKGFNRRWSYGEKTKLDIYSYAIVMKLDGETNFYDFTDSEYGETRYSSMTAQCRKTK